MMAGFIDLQVNGYAGVDFNVDNLTDRQFAAVARRLRKDGNDQVLATVITAPMDRMLARISRIASAIESLPEVAKVIAGIHVEGPFINPATGYVGAHPPESVKSASVDVAERLIDAGRGRVRLLTLAPESDPKGEVVRHVADQKIVVAAGHSDASLDELDQSIESGLTLFTHLGNGCPGSLARHDNIIQRVLSRSDKLHVSFIADGHHVPDFALRNYFSRMPEERIVIVTDAISAAGLGPGEYTLGDQTVSVDPDGAAWSADRTHFAGCATPMQKMVEILRTRVGASDQQIDQWTRLNPSRLLDR